MGTRFLGLAIAAVAVCAAAAPARAYIANDRWNTTATNGSTGFMGSPVIVTWSFAPDGTLIPGNPPPNPPPIPPPIPPPPLPSNLIGFLDTTFGAGPGGADLTLRPWFAYFDQATARIGQLAGITYVYEPNDDGVSAPRSFSNSSAARGILGVRGDVRLGGKTYGAGNNTLASNFFPDYGEMMINTDQSSFLGNSSNNYRALRNTLMHELMHGLGVNHVDSSGSQFLLEPTLSTAFDGPQLDDILALQRLYGDVLEKNGGNDTAGTATLLGSLSAGQSIIRGALGDSTVVAGDAIDFLSIDDASDVDYFRFTLAQPLAVTLSLTPKGTTYQIGPENQPQSTYDSRVLNDLALSLFDSSGTVQIGLTADVNGPGSGESIFRELDPGTYYARASGSLSDVQLYQLALTGAAIAPDALTWVGAISGVWNVASTANFQNAATADVFRNGDSVVFGEGAATKTVTVSQNVAPATMTVAAGSDYLFTGPGGIAVNTLTVSGGGVVELANSGNAIGGANVIAGTLRFSGAGNDAMSGAVRVAWGATLQLASPQGFAPSARITGNGRVEGDVVIPGTIAPGDGVGSLTFGDNLALSSSSVFEIEIDEAAYDMVSVVGNAFVNGTLSVLLLDGFEPGPGDTFSILTAGSVNGAFATELLPTLQPGLMWHTNYLADEITLSVSTLAVNNPGDFDFDGDVDGDDLALWQEGFGADGGAMPGQGDATGDGIVDGADFLAWQRNLRQQQQIATNAAPVPEAPASVLAVAACWLLHWRQAGRRTG